jgi:hypothetical protein
MERQYRRPAAALRIRDAMAAVQAGQGAAANG